jgi:hypothetical protein
MIFADTTRLDTASMADTAIEDTLVKYVQMEGNAKTNLV